MPEPLFLAILKDNLNAEGAGGGMPEEKDIRTMIDEDIDRVELCLGASSYDSDALEELFLPCFWSIMPKESKASRKG